MFASTAFSEAPLTTAAGVKRLSAEEANSAPPVVLTGVVTQVIPEWWAFTLQDGTDGVYVASSGPLAADVQVGRNVRVHGAAMRGNFAPSVRGARISVLPGSGMPPARRLNWDRFATGACDNTYVEVEGVVRSAGPVGPPGWEWPAFALRLDIGGNLLWAYWRNAPTPAPLVDATVRVRGVCVVFSNSQRQFQGVALSINRASDVEVLQPTARDPFDAPAQFVRQLFGFRRGAISFHRVRISGVATLQVPGGVYMQDETGGILARAASPPNVRAGDRLEAVGFPATGGYSTVLDDALVRVIGRGGEPAARVLRANDVLRRVENAPTAPAALLIRVSGTVIETSRTAQDEVLILNEEGSTFTARLRRANGSLENVARGSRVAVTGVCAVAVDERGLPASFELMMRSPGDAYLLRPPPLISRTSALRAVGGLLAALAVAAVWLALLRRRVARQTEVIRAQFERQALLQKRYSGLVENASDLVYVRDLEGRLLQVNRGFEEMTGYTQEELIGSNILIFLAPGERERARAQLANQAAADEARASSEWRFQTKNGGELVVETKERFLPEDGSAARVECIGRDVTARHRAQTKAMTERDRLEEQLHHAQKLDSVGQLAGGVAHDFNNLLTVINGYTQMLLDEAPLDSPPRDALREILAAAERAGGLTRQLLLFSRREKPSPRIVSLNELVRGVQKMLRRLIGEDIELRLALHANGGRILADPGHIEQVVTNLVVNARDAMPGGGTIQIHTADAAIGAAEAQMLGVEAGRHVKLEVADSGAGIPPEIRSRIFEPFFTTKEQGKGTGLGLSTVYGIVRQSNGAVAVESEPGRTVFTVLFPAAEGKEDAAAGRAGGAPIRGHETVLVAEDENGVRNFIATALRMHGYTVIEAANGVEALRKAEQHGGRIDLLLTDTVMPEMGGAALADEFRNQWPDCPVLHMSGYTDRMPQLSNGSQFLEKPFTAATLLARIRRLLDAGGPLD